MFLLKLDSCVMKHCQDGIEVYYASETQEYTYAIEHLYGYYEYHSESNGKPYFKQNDIKYCFDDNGYCGNGIYWSGGYWLMGKVDYVGATLGMAYYSSPSSCPRDFKLSSRGWRVYEATGWRLAHKDLHINCKYIDTNCLKNHHYCIGCVITHFGIF